MYVVPCYWTLIHSLAHWPTNLTRATSWRCVVFEKPAVALPLLEIPNLLWNLAVQGPRPEPHLSSPHPCRVLANVEIFIVVRFLRDSYQNVTSTVCSSFYMPCLSHDLSLCLRIQVENPSLQNVLVSFLLHCLPMTWSAKPHTHADPVRMYGFACFEAAGEKADRCRCRSEWRQAIIEFLFASSWMMFLFVIAGHTFFNYARVQSSSSYFYADWFPHSGYERSTYSCLLIDRTPLLSHALHFFKIFMLA
jgi:hypothetical protein